MYCVLFMYFLFRNFIMFFCYFTLFMARFNSIFSSIYLIEFLLKDYNIIFLHLFFKSNLFDRKLIEIFLKQYRIYLRGLIHYTNEQMTDVDVDKQVATWENLHEFRFKSRELQDLLILIYYFLNLNRTFKHFGVLENDLDLFLSCLKYKGSFQIDTEGYNCLFFTENNILISFIRKVFYNMYSNFSFNWDELPIVFINNK